MQDGDDEVPPPPWPVCLHFLLDDVGPYQWQIVPPSASVKAWVKGSDIYGLFHSSFKPSSSVISISMCFPTPWNVGVINVDVFWNLWGRYSLSLAFRDLSVSPTYTASQPSHLILYTGPATFFFFYMGSLCFTNNCLNVFVGLKCVGIPYFPNTRLSCFNFEYVLLFQTSSENILKLDETLGEHRPPWLR